MYTEGFNPFSLSGKTILVTGASSGIGEQCAIDLSKSGAKVALFGRNEDRLRTVHEKCIIYSPNCQYYVCDVTDKQKMEESVVDIVSNIGPIDGLVYAAGIEKTLPFGKLGQSDYQRLYDVNVVSALSLVATISKKTCRGDAPRYVLISSITSLIGRLGVAAYAASKGALVSAVKTLALELAPKQITINCISPGTILTPLMQSMLDSMTDEQQKERKSGFPLGLGRPSDISSASIFLLSEGARWITGQNIIVDGGYTSR